MNEKTSSIPREPNCLFCKIAAGAIPCHKVYEDADVLAFLDIGPIVRGHTLVIPRQHVVNYLDCPAEIAAKIAMVMPRLCRAVAAAAGAPACHVLVNNGAAAMQSVMHLHQHILPRWDGDHFHLPWPAQKLDAEKGAELAAAVAELLAGGGKQNRED